MKETAVGGAGGAVLRGVLLRPAVWLGIALGFADLGLFEPMAETTWILPLLALAYLVFGAARGQLRRPGVLRLQTIGLLGFTVLALAERLAAVGGALSTRNEDGVFTLEATLPAAS